MSNKSEIVANIIKEYGEELIDDAFDLADIFDALLAAIADHDDLPDLQEPDYDSYEDTKNGEIGAEAEFTSLMIWRELRNELKTLAHVLRHDANYHL